MEVTVTDGVTVGEAAGESDADGETVALADAVAATLGVGVTDKPDVGDVVGESDGDGEGEVENEGGAKPPTNVEAASATKTMLASALALTV